MWQAGEVKLRVMLLTRLYLGQQWSSTARRTLGIFANCSVPPNA
jgi:hypothetical protein